MQLLWSTGDRLLAGNRTRYGKYEKDVNEKRPWTKTRGYSQRMGFRSGCTSAVCRYDAVRFFDRRRMGGVQGGRKMAFLCCFSQVEHSFTICVPPHSLFKSVRFPTKKNIAVVFQRADDLGFVYALFRLTLAYPMPVKAYLIGIGIRCCQYRG